MGHPIHHFIDGAVTAGHENQVSSLFDRASRDLVGGSGRGGWERLHGNASRRE
jgi:hypothetical protein